VRRNILKNVGEVGWDIDFLAEIQLVWKIKLGIPIGEYLYGEK
jgi:hypothetical protein